MENDLVSQMNEALDEQFRALRQMTKAHRLRYFKNMFLVDFQTEIDDTTYIVCQHYSTTAKETLAEVTERVAKENISL